MRIADIFRHDLSREVKEVIKIDDADIGDVAHEIGEYVVTDHIHDAFSKVLDQYQESIQKPTEVVNAWVSGFFGSGKSSFAKVLGYVLANPDLGGAGAADLFTSKLPTQQLKAVLNAIHRQAPTFAVFVDLSSSYNVAREGESIVLPLYRQLLTNLDYPRDPALAELEITLEADGKLDDFVTAFQEATGREWWARRDKPVALNEASKALHHLDPDTYPSSDSYLRTRPEVEVTANMFAKRSLELLKRRRPRLSRIMFVVDEVGQYVARSVHRMLDLQGLAQACQKEDGRLWLVATGQETLEDVVGALGDKRVELARVRDRFPMTVDLVPGDIKEVVSKRVLAKNESGMSTVRQTYEMHQNQLRANVTLDSPTRRPDFSGDEFVRVYPLLPYQIQLFIDAVSGLRAHGGVGPMVGGANRTLIRLAHQLVRSEIADRPVGELTTVPMAYGLMNEMVPSAWRDEIDQLTDRHGEGSVEAQVTKSVALVSNVKALKLDVHNLAVLIHPSSDAESRRPEVARALETLVHEETLRESEEGYRLQSPQEKDWDKTRRSRELKTGDFNRLLREKQLPSMLRGLAASAGREFTVRTLYDDDKLLDGDLTLRIYEGGQDQVERAVRHSRESAHENDVFLVFERSERTWRNAEEVFLSQEMIRDAEVRSLESSEAELLHEERKRYDRAARQLERSLAGDMLNGNLVFRGNQEPLDGKDLRTALSKALGDHAEAIYTRLDEFTAPVRRTDAVTVLRTDDLSGLPDYLGSGRLRVITVEAEGHKIDETGPVAELAKAVKERVDYGSEPTGKYLESYFQKPPFGAEPDVVMVLAAAAVRAGLVRVFYGGTWLSSRVDARLHKVFSGTQAFRAAAFRTREELDVSVRTRVARVLHNDLVGERPGLSTEDLASFARRHLEADRENTQTLSATLTGLGLQLPETVLRARQLLERMRSEEDDDLVQSLDGGRADLKDGVLAARRLREYIDSDELDVFRRASRVLDSNGEDLSDDAREALEKAREILRTCAYVDRFAELRGAIEAIETDRQQAWERARERLQRAIDEVNGRASGLLDQVGEAAREQFQARLQHLAVRDEATPAEGPSPEVMHARAAHLPQLVDDLRAEVGRRQGKDVRRVPVRELFSEPVRDEEELEALIGRIRVAAEEALKDDEYFLLT